MRRASRQLLICLLVLAIKPSETSGQVSYRPFTEFGIGLASGIGGDYTDRTTPAVSVTVATQPQVSKPLLLGVHVVLLNSGAQDDLCAPVGCTQQYPFAGAIALTAGTRSHTQLDVNVGPALIRKLRAKGAWAGLLMTGRYGTSPGRYLSPGVVVSVLAARVDRALLVSTQIGLGLRLW